MIGIIFAMESEVIGVLQTLKPKQKKHIGVQDVYEFDDFVITKSGIGKVNAAVACATLIESYQVTKVLSIGISGAYSSVEQGSWMIGETLMYHDVDCRIFGYEMGIIPDVKHHFHSDPKMISLSSNYFMKKNETVHVVSMAVGDKFIEKRVQVKDLYESHPFVGIDMESTAIAQTCDMFHVPFLAIRLVSDVLETKCPLSYPEFENECGNRIVNVALDLIQILK